MHYTELIIKNDFKDVEWNILKNTVEYLPEGAGHHGVSSLIRYWLKDISNI